MLDFLKKTMMRAFLINEYIARYPDLYAERFLPRHQDFIFNTIYNYIYYTPEQLISFDYMMRQIGKLDIDLDGYRVRLKNTSTELVLDNCGELYFLRTDRKLMTLRFDDPNEYFTFDNVLDAINYVNTGNRGLNTICSKIIKFRKKNERRKHRWFAG